MKVNSLGCVVGVLATVFSLASSPGAAPDSTGRTKIRFEKHQLDSRFRSEGVAVGDFNRDGKKDIAAGFVWYEAPSWKMHAVATEPPAPNSATLGSPPWFDPKGYANSFACFADDLNGDGWTDLLVIDFPGAPTWWFENPRDVGKTWTRRLCTPVTNNESPLYTDLTGDGRREIVAPFAPSTQESDGADRQMGFMTPGADPQKPWTIHGISAKAAPGTRKYAHGLGVGDINGDGRSDVVFSDGWWEAPADRSAGDWKFHAAAFGERPPQGEGKAAHLIVFDADGDKDADVLCSSPHAYGIWWHEQLPGEKWKTHEIDKSFSQTHAVCLADLDGDGLPDFVTGKRWKAHWTGDPGGDEPAVLAWFQCARREGKTLWTRHLIDEDSGVGTQFELADVDGDGRLDIAAANKKGVFFFRQVRD